MAQQDENLLKNVVSHAKEYGFIFPSSEIYDGLAAVYDYGQNGVELKNNLKEYWWRFMTQVQDNIVGIDSAIFMHPTIWKASGHVDAFNDPMVDNKDSKKRYRADVLDRHGSILWVARQMPLDADRREVLRVREQGRGVISVSCPTPPWVGPFPSRRGSLRSCCARSCSRATSRTACPRAIYCRDCTP